MLIGDYQFITGPAYNAGRGLVPLSGAFRKES
jgi:hypothetical protein